MESRSNCPRALALLHLRLKPDALFPTLVRSTLREKSIYWCQVWDSKQIVGLFAKNAWDPLL